MRGAQAEPFPLRPARWLFIPSNAVHGFRNTSGVHVQLWIIGGPRIEAFLVEAGTAEPQSTDRETAEPDSSKFLRMLELAKRHGQTFLGE